MLPSKCTNGREVRTDARVRPLPPTTTPYFHPAGQSTCGGVTLLELMMTMVIISIMAVLFLPALGKVQQRSKRVVCMSNLKQVGVAFHSFAHEHDSQFPMQVSTNVGGSLEFLRAATNFQGNFYFAYRHFQALATELGDPKVLVCPADRRAHAATFKELSNDNVSYFLGANADYAKPSSILAGDRNLTRLGPAYGSILILPPDAPAEWTPDIHDRVGNLLYSDGSAATCNNSEVRAALGRAALPMSMLLPPVLTPRTGAASQSAGASPASSLLNTLAEAVGTQPKSNVPAGPGVPGKTVLPPASPVLPPPQPPPAVPGSSTVATPPVTVQISNQVVAPGAAASAPAKTNFSKSSDEAQDITPNEPWPLSLAQSVEKAGSRYFYLLLLLLVLAILTMLEIQRRRARKRSMRKI